MTEILFHCTAYDKLPEILKHGLIPKKPDVPGQPKAIYLHDEQFAWMDKATDHGKHRGALLEVDVTGLKLSEDIGTIGSMVSDYKIRRGWYTKRPISPKRIICIAVETAPGSMKFKLGIPPGPP